MTSFLTTSHLDFPVSAGGTSSKLIYKMRYPPVHRPLYKTSPLELEEAKKQIESMLEHGFIRPLDSPHGPPVLLILERTGAFSFVLTTIG